MAEKPRNAQYGAAGAHLMEFSYTMQQRATPEQRGPAKVIQLPLWPEAKRGAPNAKTYFSASDVPVGPIWAANGQSGFLAGSRKKRAPYLPSPGRSRAGP